MEGRRHSLGHSDAPSLHGQLATSIHDQRTTKRQRSNPAPDIGFDDLFGGGFPSRCSPVSDPDIDYNPQSRKRQFMQVMANNLTHMRLRPPASAGASQPVGTSTDDPVVTPPSQIQSTPFTHHLPYSQSYNPAPVTPPGGCSPQRTVISEMSEGPDPGGEILQPMVISDVSLSQGKASGITVESTSETADSDSLELREQSVSLTCQAWGTCGAAGVSGVQSPNALGSGAGAGAGGPSGFGNTTRGGGVAVPYGLAAPCPPAGLAGGAGGGASSSPFTAFLTRRVSDATGGSTGYGLPPAGASKNRSVPRADIPTSPSDTRFGGLDLRKTALLNNANAKSRQTERACSEAFAAASLTGAVAGVATADAIAGNAPAGGSGGGNTAQAAAAGLRSSEQPLTIRGAEGVAGGAGTNTVPLAAVNTDTMFLRCGGPLGTPLSPALSHQHQHPLPPKYPHHQHQHHQHPLSQYHPQPDPRASAAASRSDSAVSDAMSEGGGGGWGGFVGMETSSASADGAGVGGGGGLDDTLEDPQEGSGEARLAAPAQGVLLGSGLGAPEGFGASRSGIRALAPLAPMVGPPPYAAAVAAATQQPPSEHQQVQGASLSAPARVLGQEEALGAGGRGTAAGTHGGFAIGDLGCGVGSQGRVGTGVPTASGALAPALSRCPLGAALSVAAAAAAAAATTQRPAHLQALQQGHGVCVADDPFKVAAARASGSGV